MLVRPSVRVCVRLKPVLLVTHSLVFLKNLAQLYLLRITKNWQEQNFEENTALHKSEQDVSKMGQKCCFLHFLKNFSISFSWKYSKLKTYIVIYISLQTPYLAKFWFSSYRQKCFWLIRLQVYLKCSISRKKGGI